MSTLKSMFYVVSECIVEIIVEKILTASVMADKKRRISTVEDVSNFETIAMIHKLHP